MGTFSRVKNYILFFSTLIFFFFLFTPLTKKQKKHKKKYSIYKVCIYTLNKKNMPSVIKYHVFQEKTFQGLVYCDYCGKLLWGIARQGVHCAGKQTRVLSFFLKNTKTYYIECGYNCHTSCSDLVIQCRQPRRLSPDSLSVTDSEPESLSKYRSTSYDRHLDDTNSSTHSSSARKPRKLDTSDLNRSQSSSKLLEDALLKSPTTTATTATNKNKAFRKSLKHQLQQHNESSMSPHATAKAFTRLVARSKAFFYVAKFIYDIYSWKNKLFSILVCLFWIATCKYLFTGVCVCV